MLAGFILLQTEIISQLRNIELIGWTTIIFGILLFISDKFKLEKNINDNFNFKSALIIGFFQILSLIPGVSRSGITITNRKITKLQKIRRCKNIILIINSNTSSSFFFGIYNLLSSKNISFSFLNLVSIILSFIFSFLTIKYFLKYMKRFSLKVFVVYRIILGFIILSLIYL